MTENVSTDVLAPDWANDSSTSRATPKPDTTRRDLMLALGSIAGLGALAAETQAQSPPTTGRVPETMLLRRCSYGVTVTDRSDITTLGFDGWLLKQMTMTANDDKVCEAAVKANFPRAQMGFGMLRVMEDDWNTSNQLIGATLYRAAHSKRQLYWRMCEFWFDHLNIDMGKVGAWQTVDYYNSVIRRYALGKFPDMLYASARHPAMMMFLDNANSFGGNPNQNYARELMELHTLSSGGGYTQTDVEELARCLTGWGVEWDGNSPDYGEFMYYDWGHDEGSKVVLGQNIPAGGGQNDGETLVHYLAMHPNTAKFVAKKMVRWFLGVGNFTTVEDLVTQKYLATGGDIKEMLKVILKPANLLVAEPKLKRPFHLYASMLRCVKGTFRDVGGIRWAYLGQSGHEPFTWTLPNGFSDDTDYWVGLMLPRWNFALNLMSGGLREIYFDWKTILGTAPTPDQAVDRLNGIFFAKELSQPEKDRLKSFVSAGTLDENRMRGSIALAMCSPAFQWY